MKLLAICSIAASILYAAVTPAVAHGFVSQPPSRQALCQLGQIPASECGGVQFEPQSVEAPHGSLLCNGGGSRFAELNVDANFVDHAFTVSAGVDTLTFVWTLTAPHATSTWEYIALTSGDTLLTSIDSGGAVPPFVVAQDVPLDGLTGEQTILARWNIADTPNTFYSCVDLFIESSDTISGNSTASDGS